MHSKVVYLAPEVLRRDVEFPDFKFERSFRRPVTNTGDRAQIRGWPFFCDQAERNASRQDSTCGPV